MSNQFTHHRRAHAFRRSLSLETLERREVMSGMSPVISGAEMSYVDVAEGSFNRPLEIAVTEDGRNAYGAIAGASTLSVHSRNPDTGELHEVQRITDKSTLYTINSVAVSPDDRSVYVTTGSMLNAYRRDETTGELTPVQSFKANNGWQGPGSILDAMHSPVSVTVSPDGEFAYVLNGRESDTNNGASVLVFKRDWITGRLTYVENETDGPSSPAYQIRTSRDGNIDIGAFEL